MTDSALPVTGKRNTRRPKRLTLADLDRIVLKSGGHGKRTLDSLCVMEAVAWFAGCEHTDHPPCVSPVIGAFLRSWNDAMSDEDRQMLKSLIPRVINTAARDAVELQRSYLALDWYCRVSTPAWLRLAGLTAEAEAIEATAPIVDSATAHAAQRALNRARDAAVARSASAWSAVASVARSAAQSARLAAQSPRSAQSAWSVESAAESAAPPTPPTTARPTVEQLQVSALGLLDRMIALSTTDGAS